MGRVSQQEDDNDWHPLSLKPKINVGTQVKKARHSKLPKMTQKELADKLAKLGWSIGQVGVRRIERGERLVTALEVVLLTKALDVEIRYLTRGFD